MKRLNFLLSILLLLCFQTGFAQADEVIGDDEDTAETPAPVSGEVFAEARLRVNNAETKILPEMTITGGQTLNLKIDRLKSGTLVLVKIEKAGMKVETKRFQANQSGELELEMEVPKTKLTATAEIEYMPSNGQPKKVKTKIMIR